MSIYAFQFMIPNLLKWNDDSMNSKNIYVIFRSLPDSDINEKTYVHHPENGFKIIVKVYALNAELKEELESKSKEFSGYDWMVDSIIKNGSIIS